MKLKVANIHATGTIWDNMVTYGEEESQKRFGNDQQWMEIIDEELKKYRAIDLRGTLFFDFENEADITFFLLRWA